MDPATRGLSPSTRLDIDDASDDKTWLDEECRDLVPTYAQAEAEVDQHIDRSKSKSHNIVGAAITLGLAVIMLILMAIVAGYFVQEAPSNGAFTNAINQVESVGGTAFVLLAVALLAVPVVAIVAYFSRSGLGGFLRGGGGMGR